MSTVDALLVTASVGQLRRLAAMAMKQGERQAVAQLLLDLAAKARLDERRVSGRYARERLLEQANRYLEAARRLQNAEAD